jgi:hypothetical protein
MQSVLLWGSAFPLLSASGTSVWATAPVYLKRSTPAVARTATVQSAAQQPATMPRAGDSRDLPEIRQCQWSGSNPKS